MQQPEKWLFRQILEALSETDEGNLAADRHLTGLRLRRFIESVLRAFMHHRFVFMPYSAVEFNQLKVLVSIIL